MTKNRGKGFCLACFSYKPIGKNGLLVTHKSPQYVTHKGVEYDKTRPTIA